MTRIRIMGMALVCAFALLAVAAAGASAAPEFSSAGAEITTVSGTGVLVGAGTTITCTSDGGKGEVTSKTQINSTVTFKGCSGEVFGGKCPSEITSVLTGTLGEVAKGEAESEVGLLFKPKSGTTFAEFKCGIITVKVTGTIAGEVKPIKTPGTKGTVTFALASGKQKIKKIIVGGKEEKPKLTVLGSESTLTSVEENTFSKELEVT